MDSPISRWLATAYRKARPMLALTGLICGADASCLRAQRPASATPPNFVILLADDLGWGDVGYHGSDIRTPNLDALAAQGRRLEHFYVTPQCTPTRVALLTGNFPSRYGPGATHANDDPVLPKGTPTLASLLQANGYQTALVGKWHLGSTFEYGPAHYGFGYSYGSLTGAIGMYDHRQIIRGQLVATWHRNHERIDELGHVTDLTAREAIRWIETRKPGEPWFLYVAFNAPHTPLVEGDPAWFAANAHIDDPWRRLYAAAVTHLDDAIGRILRAIDTSGHADHTVVIFFSDNGAVRRHAGDRYPPPDPAMPEGFARNAPLRGYKTEVYEGGIRVPAIVRGPPPLVAPGEDETPLHVADLLPTLLDLAGLTACIPPDIDGVSARQALAGAPLSGAPREFYWDWFPRPEVRRQALRLGDWKLVLPGPEAAPELYQLGADPLEAHDLAAGKPAIVADLLARVRARQARDARHSELSPVSRITPQASDTEAGLSTTAPRHP